VALRICLVTPFTWSQPHPVNENVAGIAAALRQRGHHVTVLAPSNRAADLRAGRRTLERDEDADFIAVGPAIPITRRSTLGIPVGVRANLALALAKGRFDIVHGFEPGLPSLSYLALRETRSLTVASFLSSERIAYLPAKSRRERLLGRIDALLASDEAIAAAAQERFPGDYRLLPEGVDTDLFRPGKKRRLIAAEWRSTERAVARSLIRALRELEDWELLLLRTKPLAGRPSVPHDLRDRVHVRTARDAETRAQLLAEAAVFVPAPGGLGRLRLEAEACGAASADPPALAEQPQLAAAAVARLVENETVREELQADARKRAEKQSWGAVGAGGGGVYRELCKRRRAPRKQSADPLAGREWILCDLHMHTSSSPDCSVEVDDLLDHAEEIGLGAIAVTDHNVFAGAPEAASKARSRKLIVIAGEEIKTDGQGEVIGLFLEKEIPRGLSFAETLEAIHGQGGLVYVPHPFDRLHSVPDSATLRRHLAEIDAFEAYNARLVFETFNDEALRFARKYNLIMGAGSDAHVLQGVGTGCVRMRSFEGPEEFLISLHGAEIVRRPRSLVYLQSLKWAAQVKERTR
jgi:predicted metal-dependent phosphoesterase TrpH/glycosyltransferase involved in cell wall biosynthesis